MTHRGTQQYSLTHGETYPFWLAERSALDAGLDSTRMEPGAFVDSTFVMRLFLEGQAGSDPALGVRFSILRDERLLSETFTVRWTPETVQFRRLAVNSGTLGSFQDLTWHVVSPEGGPELISSGVVLGLPPAGVQEATPFTDFERDLLYNPDPPGTPLDQRQDVTPPTYVLWAATDAWTGSFSPTAPGYAWFRILSCNFDIDAPALGSTPRPGFFCD
jgi:hypothetical protein